MRSRIRCLALLACAGTAALLTFDVGSAEPQAAPVALLVTGSDGAPLAGATVRVLRPPLEVLRTGDDGRLEVAALTGQQLQLRVEAPGRAPTLLSAVAAGSGLTVKLEPGHRVVGRVIDLTTAEALAGASVALCDPAADVFGPEACARATTDESGAFTVDGLAAGSHAGEVHAAAHEKKRIDLPVPQRVDPESGLAEALLVYLGPGGDLSGTVLTESGEAVAGAEVRATPIDVRVIERGKLVRTTDEQGRFAFEGLKAGFSYRLSAQPEGFAPADRGPYAIDTPGAVIDDARLVVTRGATLRFRLVDDEERPVAAETVTIRREEDSRRARRARTFDRELIDVGEGGLHTLPNLPPGSSTVVIRAPCCLDAERTAVELAPGDPIDLGTIILDPGATIRGKVTDTAGEPVPDAELKFSWRDGPAQSRQTTTDERGEYRGAGLAEDAAVRVRVSKTGFVDDTREEVTPGEADVDFVLERTGAISGVVRLPNGAPATAFRIQAYRTTEDEVPSPTGRRAAPTERDYESAESESGRFVLDGLAAGDYTLLARAPRLAPARKEGVKVVSDRTAEAGTLTLREGITLTGRVITTEEEPVPGAIVQVSRPQATMLRRTAAHEASAVADLDGTFELEGMEPGAVVVTAAHGEYSPAEERVELVELEEDGDPPRIELKLGLGGALTGTVRDGDGLPVPDVRMMLGKSGAFAPPDMESTRTGEDGRYGFERLSPGHYRVVRTSADGDSRGLQSKSAEVVEGENTVVDFDEEAAINLSGRVLRRDEPVREALLLLTPEGAPALSGTKTTTTDADGAYRIGLDGPGTYRVAVPMGGRGVTVGSVLVDVPDEREVHRDLVLDAGGAIAGSVHDDGKPVRGAFVLARLEGAGGPAPVRVSGHAITDSDGAFEIEGVEPGAYRVSAAATGFITGERHPIAVADDRVTVEFQLERGLELLGKVVDPQGNPVPEAIVFAGIPGSVVPLAGPILSDVNGRFELAAPDDAPIDVAVISASWAPALVRNVSPSSDPGAELRITVSSGGRLVVRASTSGGQPIAGIAVQLEGLDAQFLPIQNHLARQRQSTGADGRLVLTLLPPGAYRVTAAASTPVQPIEVSIREGQEVVAELIVGD